MKKFPYFLLLFFTSLITLSSCGEKDPDNCIKEWPDSDHTYLIYMMGDNTLTDWCKPNTENAIKGLLQSETPINLVIYDDSKRSKFGDAKAGTPTLFRLKRNYENKQKVDTIMIHQFEKDHDSSDPEIMQSIINEAFAACPASVKGMEIWCHGLGWAPSPYYKEETRASQWIGPDDDRYMEIWQLRKALEKCPHLNYIAFDACNMGQAEVAYELKDVADYMMACPTEIMAAGLPYTDMIRILSDVNSASSLPQSFPEICHAFKLQAMVSGGGTFSILDLKAITELHHAYKSLRAACSDQLLKVEEMPYAHLNSLQQFGRGSIISMGAFNLFFDMLTVADLLAKDQPDLPEYLRVKEAINKAVLCEYHSDSFLEFENITCCGMGVGVPEIFTTTLGSGPKMLSAYNQLKWTKE